MMISSAKTMERLPFCSYSFKRLGVLRLINFLFCTRRGSLQGLRSQMSQSLKGLEMGFQAKVGVVLPVTGDHVGEVVDATKAGQVIAVPTNTLYEFACDAWKHHLTVLKLIAILYTLMKQNQGLL